MSKHLHSYLVYIRNCGCKVPTMETFDDDWAPAGVMIREQLFAAGLILYRKEPNMGPLTTQAKIYLTQKGGDILAGMEA